MNITKSFLAIAFTAVVLTGCKETAKAPETPADNTASSTNIQEGKMETASFNIEGMSCAVGCAKTIESKLAGMDGVKKATVDFEKKSATVEFDASKQSAEKLVETVEATAGGETYKVSNVTSSGDKAMVFNKEKKKKKSKKSDDKKADCAADAKDGKKGCCAAKKACHEEKAAM